MTTITHEPVKQAMNRIRQLSADEEARRLVFVRERALHDEVSFLNEARREALKEGHKKGHKEGHKEGRLEEARDLLRTQLSIKFGAIPDWVEERIQGADHQQLRGWMGDLLRIDALDELFRG
jgi:flagellar biosynthesis/type III secretory pathway protein FliH